MSKQEKLLRFKIISELVSKGKNIDLGAGLPNPYLKNVLGVDLQFKNKLKLNYKNYNALIKSDLNKELSFKDNSFNNVIASCIIEHLDNPLNFLKECYRICKPKGKVIIVTDNVFYYNRYLWYISNKMNKFHLIEIPQNSMKQLFRKVGLKNIKQRGDFIVVPYLRKLLESRNPYVTKTYITVGIK